MLSNLTLRNFRQHRDLTLDFTHGITVLRGANEAGKSSVFEGIIYALFGLRACRNNDIVTWGEDSKNMKVELTLSLPEGECRISRSLRSAELRMGDRVVSGQGDVTAVAEELLGLLPGTGSKIVYASQRDIRGVLEEGNGKVAQLIEELADVGAIDRIIEKLQETEVTGSTASLEAALEAAQQALETLGHREAPDLTMQEEEVARLEAKGPELLKKQAEVAQEIGKLDELWRLERQRDTRRTELSARIRQKSQQVSSLEAELEAAKQVPQPDTDRLAMVEKQLAEATQINEIAELYSVCARKAHQTIDSPSLPQPRKVLEQRDEELSSKLDECKKQRKQLKEQIAHQESLLDGVKVCRSCGQPLPETEETRKAREDAPAVLESLRADLAKLAQGEAEAAAEQASLDVVLEAPDHSAWASKHPEHIAVDKSFTPAKLVWTGPTGSPVDVSELTRERDELKATEAVYRSTLSKLESLPNQLATATAEQEEAQKELAQLGHSRTDELTAEGKSKQEEAAKLKDEEAARKLRLSELRSSLAAAQSEYANWKDRVASATSHVAEAESQLEKLRFNNALLRRLRQLKPEISNKVWSAVLHTVSHFFSKVRGVQASVSKTQEGFLVSGKPVDSLSGSTADMLGLALRLTLLKTFSPSCRFLLLDEPFAACDTERQEAAMSLLLGAGVEQVVVITHEDVSESVAGNLLTL